MAEPKPFSETEKQILDGLSKHGAAGVDYIEKQMIADRKRIAELRQELQKARSKIDAHRDWIPLTEYDKKVADLKAENERLRQKMIPKPHYKLKRYVCPICRSHLTESQGRGIIQALSGDPDVNPDREVNPS